MNGGTIVFILAGMIAFGCGAYFAATGERPMGITFMGFGLMFQVLALVRLKQAKKKELNDAG